MNERDMREANLGQPEGLPRACREKYLVLHQAEADALAVYEVNCSSMDEYWVRRIQRFDGVDPEVEPIENRTTLGTDGYCTPGDVEILEGLMRTQDWLDRHGPKRRH